jgi:branched-subunit amino acid ABC-type transport system permease component
MLSVDVILQILWTSIATSSYFVLFALAFSFVLKVNGVFNFAQAAMMTAAFYAAYTAVSLLGLPGWVGFAASLAGSLAIGAATELLGFRMLRRTRAEPLFVFIFTLIVSEVVAYAAMLIFGTYPATIFPSLLWPVTLVGNVAVSTWDIRAVVATALSVGALFAYLRFSRTGQFMIAVADNSELAELYGINRERIFLVTMLVGAALVAIGMFLYGTRGQVEPATSINLMLLAIAATIIGGIGNLMGAVIAAVVLCIIQNASVLVIPSQWQGFLLYVFLFVAIVFMPNGFRWPDRQRLSRKIAPGSAGTAVPDLAEAKKSGGA